MKKYRVLINKKVIYLQQQVAESSFLIYHPIFILIAIFYWPLFKPVIKWYFIDSDGEQTDKRTAVTFASIQDAKTFAAALTSSDEIIEI